MQTYHIALTFIEPLLGSAPMDKQIYSTYIANAIAEQSAEEEITTINEDKGKTGFHRSIDGQPILYDYVIKGYLKDACGMLRRSNTTRSAKISAYKRVIDGMVFIEPRHVAINVIGEVTTLERPLRAQTAMGERVALACSELIPSGSKIEFALVTLEEKTVTVGLLNEWLDYGKYRGLGQWRNGGYGRFTYTIAAAYLCASMRSCGFAM